MYPTYYVTQHCDCSKTEIGKITASLYWNFQPHFPIRYINLAGYEGKELFIVRTHCLVPFLVFPLFLLKDVQ